MSIYTWHCLYLCVWRNLYVRIATTKCPQWGSNPRPRADDSGGGIKLYSAKNAPCRGSSYWFSGYQNHARPRAMSWCAQDARAGGGAHASTCDVPCVGRAGFKWVAFGGFQTLFSNTFQTLFKNISTAFQHLLEQFSATIQKLSNHFSKTFQALFTALIMVTTFYLAI